QRRAGELLRRQPGPGGPGAERLAPARPLSATPAAAATAVPAVAFAPPDLAAPRFRRYTSAPLDENVGQVSGLPLRAVISRREGKRMRERKKGYPAPAGKGMRRRLMFALAWGGVAAAAYCWGRYGSPPKVRAEPTPARAASAPEAGGLPSDYSRRP